MSKPVTQFNLEVLPFGFCPACIDRMREGQLFQARALGDGAHLLSAYCVERQVGATLELRADRAQRWRLVVPIEALEWEAYLKFRAMTRKEVLDAIPIVPKPH